MKLVIVICKLRYLEIGFFMNEKYVWYFYVNVFSIIYIF